jgi:hypothetical protein
MIKVLEETREILLAISTCTNKTTRTRNTTQSSGNELPEHAFGNSFDPIGNLIGMEGDITDIDTSEICIPALPVTDKKPNKIFEAQAQVDDLCFDLFCYFKDFNRLRQYLKQVWSDNVREKVDLSVSALYEVRF